MTYITQCTLQSTDTYKKQIQRDLKKKFLTAPPPKGCHPVHTPSPYSVQLRPRLNRLVSLETTTKRTITLIITDNSSCRLNTVNHFAFNLKITSGSDFVRFFEVVIL